MFPGNILRVQNLTFKNIKTINGSLWHRISIRGIENSLSYAASVKIFMQQRYVDCIKSNRIVPESCSNIHALVWAQST